MRRPRGDTNEASQATLHTNEACTQHVKLLFNHIMPNIFNSYMDLIIFKIIVHLVWFHSPNIQALRLCPLLNPNSSICMNRRYTETVLSIWFLLCKVFHLYELKLVRQLHNHNQIFGHSHGLYCVWIVLV